MRERVETTADDRLGVLWGLTANLEHKVVERGDEEPPCPGRGCDAGRPPGTDGTPNGVPSPVPRASAPDGAVVACALAVSARRKKEVGSGASSKRGRRK